MHTPRVSVVIPYFNGQKWLGRALKSVANQTCPASEVVIVDDGSQSEPLLAQQVHECLHDVPVQIWRHPTNKGIPAARNTAITHASGEYIAFLDQDDEWLPDKLDHQLRTAVSHKAAIVFSTVQLERGSALNPRNMPCERLGLRLQHSTDPHERCGLLLEQGDFVPIIGLLVHRTVFERVGLMDEQLRGGSDDYDFTLRCALNYPFFYTGPEPLAIHHLTGGNYSNARRFYDDNMTILRKLTNAEPELKRYYRSFVARNEFDLCLYERHVGRLFEAIVRFGKALGSDPALVTGLCLAKLRSRFAARNLKGNVHDGNPGC